MQSKVIFTFLLFVTSFANICLGEKFVKIATNVSSVQNSEKDKASIAELKKNSVAAEVNVMGQVLGPQNLPDFVELSKRIVPSVVSVLIVTKEDDSKDEIKKWFEGGGKGVKNPLEEFFKNFMDEKENKKRKGFARGSGFFIKVDSQYAYVVINSHMVETAFKVSISIDSKDEIKAEIHGVDSRSDLAVLRVNLNDVPKELRNSITPLEWGDSEEAKVGQWVLACGDPFTLCKTVTVGIISAKSRDLYIGNRFLIDDFIQHSASINVGSSGGCLVDMSGKVIGVNNSLIGPAGGNVGIGFAIPSNKAKKIVEELINKKKITRGSLGINIQDFTKEMAEGIGSKYKNGNVVVFVKPNSPASKAGMKQGDIIVEFNGRIIDEKNKIAHLVSEADISKTHKVKILRNGKEMILNVTLEDFDKLHNTDIKGSQGQREKPVVKVLGMSLIAAREADEFLKQSFEEGKSISEEGLMILDVSPDSSAEEIGLGRGDIIEEINQIKVNSPAEFKRIVDNSQKQGKKYVFLMVRLKSGTVRFISLRIEQEDESSENTVSSQIKKGFFLDKDSVKANSSENSSTDDSVKSSSEVVKEDEKITGQEVIDPKTDPKIVSKESSPQVSKDSMKTESENSGGGKIINWFKGLF